MRKKAPTKARPTRKNPAISGEKHWNAKLTPETIAFIRAAEGRQRDIAAALNLSQKSVSLIKARKAWAHL